jgi:tetratricopeptide (TPR) repeat protein
VRAAISTYVGPQPPEATFWSQSMLTSFVLILLIGPPGTPEGQEIQTGGPAAIPYEQRLRTARASYEAKDYVQAAALYQELAQANPKDGETWLRLARSRYQLNDYRAAVEAFGRANEIGFGQLQQNDLAIARAYAKLGEKDNALTWLGKALNEQRFEFRPDLQEDEAFQGLRSDPTFQKLAGLLPKREFTREEGWRYDLDYLLAEIQRLNASFSRQPLPETVQRAADRIRGRIATLTDAQIAVEMQRLLALLGCSHNSLIPAPGGRVNFAFLPLTYYLFPDGPYLIDGDGEASGFVGARVVRFDDTDAAEAVSAVSALARRENDVEALWLAPSYLAMPQVLHALGMTKNADPVRLTLRRGSEEKTLTVSAGKPRPPRKLFPSQLPGAAPAPLYLENVANAYWFKHLPERQTVYFQFNQIVNKDDESLAAFALRLRQFLDKSKVQKLVVDLRHNNGGNTYLYNELVRTIVHFDAAEPSRKLFVLIGRNTYSAAVNFAVDLERFTRAVFVGEPTGGKPNTHGDESPTVLPYSGLHFLLSCVYWQLSSPRDTRLWIPAAIPVPLTAQDYFANRDRALDFVLELNRE